MTQERAARTRATLIRAAAVEFDRYGYATTSLNRIAKSAGLSTGALTFHFARKDDLADAVVDQACRLSNGAPERALRPDPERNPLVRLGALVTELLRCIHEHAEVRGSVRLELDRPQTEATWSGRWFEAVRELAAQAQGSGGLPRHLRPEQIELLVTLFVFGAGCRSRDRVIPWSECSELWATVWEGVQSPDGTRTP
ncbi:MULTISPECIES: TetR family transcriptional regulator [unclassified Streptomyces]|uniref:TetR family transcriptional regulator n=1 Tax=unclassified Streptomyces TaxID=2593676 RepID=UPI00136C4D53|nr:TetR family transcriptional regulator [Streptomyces sp. SID6139]MYR04813.1 TetR family transcriptional regulator [Streptomyces sp. SID6139]MYR17588.1 TetR family transcriptional regulator [Streptomyces sp. SID6137]